MLGAGKAADFRARLFALNLNERRQCYTKLVFQSKNFEGDKNIVESMFPQHSARMKPTDQPRR